MRLNRRGFVHTALGGAMSLSCLPPQGMSVQRDQKQDEFENITVEAEQFRKKYDVPGLSIAIARNERLVVARGFGFADTSAGRRAVPTNLFRIASVSKPITSVTLFRLIEHGKLKLSDTVFGAGSILGNDFGAPPYVAGVESITIEHLMTHTGGGWQNDGDDPMFSHPEMNHKQLIEYTIANQPLKNMPGEKYAYSNFGYCVLGRVIERLTGQSYPDAVQSLVLDPCGIKSMRIGGDTEAERAPLEVTYYAGPNTGSPYGMKVSRMDAHGGWLATPTDLVKFLTRVDGFPSRPDILKQSTIKTMTSGNAASGGYAHGWNVNSAGNYWHNGSLRGTTSIAVRTSNGYCWAAITNIRRPGTDMDADLDRLMWRMVKGVNIWPDYDLFKA